MKTPRVLWLALALVIGGVLSYVAAQNQNSNQNTNSNTNSNSNANSNSNSRSANQNSSRENMNRQGGSMAQNSITVQMMDAQGQSVGTAMISPTGNMGVRVK